MKSDMTQGKIFPLLMKFTLPMMVGDLFQQFYNIVDTIIVGRTLGANALAAVGSTGTIMFLTVGFCTAMANGLGVVTAQRFGAKDEAGVRSSFSNGIYLIALVSAVLSCFFLLFTRRLLTLMNTPEDIFEYAVSYISVIFAGLAVTAFYNYFAANLRAIGNSRVPLYFLIFASGLNIVLDLAFIILMGMGVAGAALATILSQLISVLLCVTYIMMKEPVLQPKGSDWKLHSGILRQQLEIGLPMAIQNSITSSGTIIMQSATNIFGSTAVAAVTASTKCRTLFSVIMISMGNGVATFVGQNYGANNLKRVKEGVYTAVKVMTVYAIAAGFIAYALLPLEIRLFISDASEIEAMMPWARITMLTAALFLVPLSYIFIFRSALQACGKSVFAMSAGLVELASRIIFAWIAIHYQIFVCAVLCDSAAWFSAGVFTCVSFIIIIKRLQKEAGQLS